MCDFFLKYCVDQGNTAVVHVKELADRTLSGLTHLMSCGPYSGAVQSDVRHTETKPYLHHKTWNCNSCILTTESFDLSAQSFKNHPGIERWHDIA